MELQRHLTERAAAERADRARGPRGSLRRTGTAGPHSGKPTSGAGSRPVWSGNGSQRSGKPTSWSGSGSGTNGKRPGSAGNGNASSGKPPSWPGNRPGTTPSTGSPGPHRSRAASGSVWPASVRHRTLRPSPRSGGAR
jgi:hypothetical protein